MSTPFPHHYRVGLVAENGRATLSDSGKPALVGGAPAQFGGRDDWWSPEHLLLSSLGLCLMATFHGMASRRSLPPVGYRSEISGELDKTPRGLEFVSLLLHVSLRVAPGKGAEVRALVEEAKKHCIVANSLKCAVELVASVEEVDRLSAVHSP